MNWTEKALVPADLFADHQELGRLGQKNHGEALNDGWHGAEPEHVAPAVGHVREDVVDQERNKDADGDAKLVEAD